jgi:hypothetical protein
VSEDVKANVNERPVGHAPGHARHDRLLIVRYAAGDLDGPDYTQASAQIGGCTDCAQLARDMTALHAPLAALPAPRRTRDFRLTAEQADKLQGSAFDRFLRRLAMPKLGLLRPVAGVGVALGLTLAVVGANVPAVSPMSAGAPPPQPAAGDAVASSPSDREGPAAGGSAVAPLQSFAESAGGVADTSGETPASVVAPGSSAKAPTDSGNMYVSAAPTATASLAAFVPVPTTAPTPETTAPSAAPVSQDTTQVLLVYGGLTLAIVAFGLLLLSIYARRRNEDPLLR